MNYHEIIATVSKETDLPDKVVDKTYKAYWSFIRAKIQDMPLKQELSDSEFSELRTNFSLPSLGRLTCTHMSFLRQKKKYEHLANIRTNNGTKNKESKTSI